jgi:hypothetical protein
MIQDLDHDAVQLHMRATPQAAYSLVADVTRMPEFSPEILSCTWIDGATGPAVGARFKARNQVPKRPAWNNKPVVTAMESGRRFSFARTEPFGGTVEWTYEFEPEGDGTRVTESYAVTKKMSPVGWFVIGILFARKDRRADLREGMERTLARMRDVVEAPAGVAAEGA